jgi:hypothetical protein
MKIKCVAMKKKKKPVSKFFTISPCLSRSGSKDRRKVSAVLKMSKAIAVVIFACLALFCFAEESEFPRKFTLNTGHDIPAIGCKFYC